MKKCPFCGADIEDSARFCLYCMHSLEEKELIRLRRKKKLPWLVIVAAVVAILLMLAFFLPGQLPKDTAEPHIHSYTARNMTNEYLMAEADCLNSAVYYSSCSCGEKGTRTFIYGKPTGHTKVTIPGSPADCVNAGSTDREYCSSCGFVSKASSTLSASGHTFALGQSPSVCQTCGETVTITLNQPAFPYLLNDSIRIEGGTCLFQPLADGSWRVRLKLTCTNISSAAESYVVTFRLGDRVSTCARGTLASGESRVISITNQVTDPNGIYDLVFVEGQT